MSNNLLKFTSMLVSFIILPQGFASSSNSKLVGNNSKSMNVRKTKVDIKKIKSKSNVLRSSCAVVGASILTIATACGLVKGYRYCRNRRLRSYFSENMFDFVFKGLSSSSSVRVLFDGKLDKDEVSNLIFEKISKSSPIDDIYKLAKLLIIFDFFKRSGIEVSEDTKTIDITSEYNHSNMSKKLDLAIFRKVLDKIGHLYDSISVDIIRIEKLAGYMEYLAPISIVRLKDIGKYKDIYEYVNSTDLDAIVKSAVNIKISGFMKDNNKFGSLYSLMISHRDLLNRLIEK